MNPARDVRHRSAFLLVLLAFTLGVANGYLLWDDGGRQATVMHHVSEAQLAEVVPQVYRPCCGNAIHFPDCNHGMAMLGLLELLAAHDAPVEELFTAAKYANAVWFPQQSAELATYFRVKAGQEFAEIDARAMVGVQHASAAGFAAVHTWLAQTGHLPGVQGSGSNCGV